MGKGALRSQQGFTLIEIIAVLIILGILAAVAIPRYFSLQDSARQAAVDGALAAGSGMLHLVYTKNVVNGVSISGLTDLSNPLLTATGENLGDFNMTYGGGSGFPVADITIGFAGSGNPTWVAGFAGTKTKVVPAPWR